MHINGRKPIVVAVGDEDEHDAAVRFAAAEAVRDDRPLRVVHVIDPRLGGPGPEQMLLTFEGAEIVGEQILQGAVDRAEEVVAGRAPVTKRLRHGSVVRVLLELSDAADRVVLQHRDLTRLRRVFTGSVTSGVAGRAQVPVVSVPEPWVDLGTDRIVVGLEDTTRPDGLLEKAFALAADRKARLTVLHAWFIPSVYEEALMGRAAVEEAREHAAARIGQRLDTWRATYPTVDAHLEVSHARPADALVAASERSDLLVLGRRGATHSLAHLGSVTRALIRESRCPVMVVPPTAWDSADAAEPGVAEQRADHG